MKPNITAVAERHPSIAEPELFKDFIAPRKPVVLRGAAAGWPACTRWSEEYFASRYGDAIVDFVDCTTGRRRERPLREYFTLPAEERSRLYVNDWDFRRRYPELLADIEVPPLFDIDWLADLPASVRPDLFWIFIGHEGTFGALHVDSFGSSAWLTIVRGEKRVRFTERAPQRRAKDEAVPQPFAADASNDTFGVIEEARLGAGDVIFVPAGCNHAAFNDTSCISVTSNFVDGSNFALYCEFGRSQSFSRRMLVNNLRRMRELEGVPRARLARHLELALKQSRDALEREISELDELASVLEESRAP